MNHKFTHSSIENLYIQSLTDAELLIYFDEKSTKVYDVLGLNLEFELEENIFTELFSREKQIVDVALSKIASNKQAKKIFERHKNQIDINGITSFSLPHVISVALLSNPNTFVWHLSQTSEFYQIREWIYCEADLKIFNIFASNPNAPHEMFESVLSKDETLSRVSEKRYIALLFAVLSSPRIAKAPKDTYDYDMTQHELIGLAWDSILKVRASSETAYYIRYAIPKIAPFEISWGFAKQRGFEDDEDWSQKAEEAYLSEFFENWTPKVEDKEVNDSFTEVCFEIRVSLIENLDNYLMRKHKKKIFSFDDQAFRIGYYKSVEAHEITIEELDKYFVNDERKLLLAILDNDSFFAQINYKKLLWMRTKVLEYVEDSDTEYFDKLERHFERRFTALGKSNSQIYFNGDSYDIESQAKKKYKESQQVENDLHFINSFEELQSLKTEIGELTDGLEGSSVKKIANKYAELFEVLSRRIGESDSKRFKDEQAIYDRIENLSSELKKYFLILVVIIIVAKLIL